MKRIITFVLIAALALACPFAHAEALRGKCGDNLTWELSDGTLTISGTGDMYDWGLGGFNVPWSAYKDGITSLVIEDGVTSIGDYSFHVYKRLGGTVTLPDSVRRVGHFAFAGSGVTAFDLPDTLEFIGRGALSASNDFTRENGGLYVGKYLVGPDGAVKELRVREGTLSTSVFFNRPERMYIPESVRYISRIDLAYTSVEIDPANKHLTFDGSGVLYAGDTLIACPPGVKTCTVKKGTRRIEECAFINADVEEVKLPDGLESIGKSAFFSCSKLKKVNVPGTVAVLPTCLFEYCYALTELELGEGIRYIDSDAMRSCSLETLTVPASVKAVGWQGVCGIRRLRFLGPYTYLFDAPSSDLPAIYNKDAAIYGVGGSFAETYAAKNKLFFMPLSYYDSPFTDVKTAAYYYAPVRWAVENGVTSGISADRFAPDNKCTRAQIVTFLWRAAGSPEPSGTEHPFTDVSSVAFYYKAMLWAVENGITDGVTATEFEPFAPCTRGQVVTFLWRAAGSPAGSHPTDYDDVKKDSFCYRAVGWARLRHVTNGVAAGRFDPAATCTRGQVASFLFRSVWLSDITVSTVVRVEE